ncbi:MAG: AsmA-like C-terminal region-containing protein [Gammaproteobacteria bacterium]
MLRIIARAIINNSKAALFPPFAGMTAGAILAAGRGMGFIMAVVRKVSGIVFWAAAMVLAAMVLFWLVNAALGYVAVGEHIGRHVSQYLPDTQAQFARARLRLSWRGLFVRAEQLHLQGKNGGLYAPQADFFIGAETAHLALHSPRITIVNNDNDGEDGEDGNDGDGGGFAFPLPVVGDDWAVIGKDAVFAAEGFDFDYRLLQRAAGFTLISRGGALQLAFDGKSGGGKTSLLAEWQNGGGIARLVMIRADDALPMHSLRLTAMIDKHSLSIAADVGRFRADGFFAPSAALRAEVPQTALIAWAGGFGFSDAITMSAQFYAAEVDTLPVADMAVGGVLHPAPDGGWRLSAGGFLFGNESAALSGGGVIVVNDGGGGSWHLGSLDITGNIAVSAAKLHTYLPPSAAREWLEESLTEGGIGGGAFAVSGTPEDLANGKGWNATAAFSGGNIIIGEQWPDAKALAGALFLHNDNLTIIGEGVFADLAVTDITAVIGNFAADTPASLQLFMRATPAPLAEYKRAALAVDALRPALTIVQTANFFGDGALAVFLTVPLTSARDTFYRVSLAVRDGMFSPDDSALPTLTALSGYIAAGNAYLTAAVRGLLYGKPAAAFYDGKRATLHSTIDAARALALAGKEEWQKYLSGDAAFTLHSDGKQTTIFAGLHNITSSLPPPMDNTKGGRLRILLPENGGGVSLLITAPSATIRMLQTAEDAAIGINVPLPPFGIAAAGEGWDLDRWLQLSGGGGGGSGLSLSVGGGKLLGMRHDFLHLHSPPPADDVRMVFVRSPVAEGTASFSPRGVRGVFDKLHLTGFDNDDDDNDNPLADALFGLSVSLRVGQLAFGGITLGGMRLEGAPENDGWRLRQMHITNGDNILRFSGFGGAGGATVSAGLHAPDVVGLLNQFLLTGLVESGAMTVRGELSWDDSAPSLAGLRGDLYIDADEVRYLGLQEGVSGLLALFSPASLFSLGFTELGKPGVRFDIDGDIVIGSGFAASESLTMKNEDIHITLGGRTDMIHRRHNIRGRVLPGNRLVKSGSTVALAAAINPPVVLAGVLLGKILEQPLSEIGAYDYEITGLWSAPEYREIGFAEKQ